MKFSLIGILAAAIVAGYILWRYQSPNAAGQPIAKVDRPNSSNDLDKDDGMKDQKDWKVLPKTDDEWCMKLTPEQYDILRKKGTERPFSGDLWNSKEKGTYRCAGCGQPLFSSETKFESGTGWPSFYQPIDKNNVATHEDHSLGMERIEVVCSRCGGHLGHVFDDGPNPTGLRFCINSGALELDTSAKQSAGDSAE